MNRWILFILFLTILLAGCSTSSEPDDPNVPANVDTSGVPGQMHYDSTVPLNFEITELDGFKQLTVEYIEDGTSVWTVNRSSGNSFKKSCKPSSQGPANARLEWEFTDAHPEADLRPFGEKMLLFRYDRPTGAGEYHGLSIPGKDGLVDVVHDYIPD